MNPYNFSLLCFGFCSFFVGLLILVKRQDAVGKSYFVLSIFYALWGTIIGINLSQSTSYDSALLATRLANGAAVFIPVFWLRFVLIYTENNSKFYRHLLKSLYFLSVFILCFVLTPWFIPKVGPIVGFSHYAQPGIIFHLYTFMFFSTVLLGFFILIKKSNEKPQLMTFALVAFIGYAGGSLTFLPIYGFHFPQYGLLLIAIYPFAMAYVIIKDKLFDIQEVAQAAHRDKLAAIGTLTTSINHEVRSPLYVIHGLAEAHIAKQKEGVFSSDKDIILKSNEILEKSMLQAKRAMDIVYKFSSFAKKNVDEALTMKAIDVKELLDGVLSLVRYELSTNEIELSCEIPVNLPSIHADQRFAEEIFFNLIVNACQSIKSSSAKGEIKITAKEIDGKIQIRVCDNGPGIPKDRLPYIFEPFHTTKDEGTGLGLFVTKQLVEKNKGEISVESDPEIETCFTLTFNKAT